VQTATTFVSLNPVGLTPRIARSSKVYNQAVARGPGQLLDCMTPTNSSFEECAKYRHMKYVKLVLTKKQVSKN